MGLGYADAYEQIKKLEDTGQLTLPETQETIEVGTIDPTAGTFVWSVPTVVQTIVIPPIDPEPQGSGPSLGGVEPMTPFVADVGEGGGATGVGGLGHHPFRPEGIPPTNQIINLTVGVVATKAVDLRLKFAVIPQRSQPPAVSTAGRTSTRGRTSAHVAAAAAPRESVVGGVLAGETNGGVTISGYPTVSSQADEITIDVGLECSTALQTQWTTPAVSRLEVTINVPGHDPIFASFFVLRPPVVGMGAFTIPALPMAIIYAPPQGKQLKNIATYSDTETITRTVTSSITSGTGTKTVQAYSVADLIGKVAGAITAVVAVVGTGGAGAAGGASVAGAFKELGEALFGQAKKDNESTADATKQISSELSLVSDILNGIDASAPPSESSVTTNEEDRSLTLALSTMSQYQSAAGLGPGLGDRIVYLKNLKVVWMAVNGEVGIVVLGYEDASSNAVNDLLTERQLLNGGQPGTLGFDVPAIDALLAQDPMAPPARPIVGGELRPPAIAPPRFVPADPAEWSGTSTGPNGDQFSITYDSTIEDKQVATTSQVHVEDNKPGWLAVLFGADEDVETTTTTTLTISHTIDTKDEVKLTSTVTFFSGGLDDPYDSKNFYDYTFGTYAYVSPNSPFLQGVAVVNEAGGLVQGS